PPPPPAPPAPGGGGVRGAAADVPALSAALGVTPEDPAAAEAAVADVSARLDVLGRSGDARLEGVLAAMFHSTRRAWLGPRLAGPLGMPGARRTADLVGLSPRLQRPYPDGDRRAGLARLALAADLGVLHAVAGAVAHTAEAREQVDWSALHAEEAGLLGESPLEPLRTGLRDALAGLGSAAADRCWAQARDAFARGRISTVDEAVAASWRWRSGAFPRLIHLVGPSGSGKSSFAGSLPRTDSCVSLDDLRRARGSRADQRANGEVLREGLGRLDSALAGGGTVVWDATSLNRHQRSLVHEVARRRDALVTHVVALVDEEELARRNEVRDHPVPPAVLASQLHRYAPPYPGEAHRTWYVGAGGTVDDTAGTLDGIVDGGET
ncbi:AAA family ATPase, partial [Streptomyces prasinus]|uniref:AAA family ATPase n=1 Tax=Streptomyces prasinus TaxID=67345 RepID=UPI00363885D2